MNAGLMDVSLTGTPPRKASESSSESSSACSSSTDGDAPTTPPRADVEKAGGDALSAPTSDESSATTRRQKTVTAIVGILALGISIVCIVKVRAIATALVHFSKWITELGLWGYLIYSLLLLVSVFLAMPTTMVEIVGGFVYPSAIAIPLNIVVKAAGANGCFLLARYTLRPIIERKIARSSEHGSRLKQMDFALRQNQYKATTLARWLPMPVGLINYGMGLCAVSLKCFAIASTIGDTPYTIIVAVFARQLSDLSKVLKGEADLGAATVIMLVGGVVSGVVLTVAAGVLVRKTFKENNEMEPLEMQTPTKPVPMPEFPHTAYSPRVQVSPGIHVGGKDMTIEMQPTPDSPPTQGSCLGEPMPAQGAQEVAGEPDVPAI